MITPLQATACKVETRSRDDRDRKSSNNDGEREWNHGHHIMTPYLPPYILHMWRGGFFSSFGFN
jgi:hypothetical protein